jgi:hypothetical protein
MSEGPTLLSNAQLKERGWKRVQVRARGCMEVSRAVAGRRAAELVLEQITVNYFRHDLTGGETLLKKVAGQAGISEAGRVVRRRAYEETTAQYSECAEECKRQMRDRSGEAQDATG